MEGRLQRGSLDELERLAAAGADIDARDGHGQTALMLAEVDGHADVVDWLVARGAMLDHTAKYGLSALMLAVVNHVNIVRTLVRAGANLGLRGTGAIAPLMHSPCLTFPPPPATAGYDLRPGGTT